MVNGKKGYGGDWLVRRKAMKTAKEGLWCMVRKALVDVKKSDGGS